MADTNPEHPLKGLRIVELGTDVASAFAGRLSAIYGADVITIEPKEGHAIRHLPPWTDDTHDPNSSILFGYLGTAKRSMEIDFNNPSSVESLRKLILASDAVIDGYTPDWLGAHNLDLDALLTKKDSLVVCHITPYGQTGPKRHWTASALTAAAAGGQLYMAGDPDKPPLLTAGHQAYYQAGLQTFGGLITALYAAKTTGQGDILDLSIQEIQAATLEGAGPVALWFGGEGVRTGNSARAMWGIHEAADGWIGVASMPRQTNSVLDAMGHGDLKTDPIFAKGGWAIEANELLSHLIPAFTIQHTAKDIFEIASNYRAPFSVIPTPAELLKWPHYEEINFWQPVDHPILGNYLVPSGPIQFGDKNRGEPSAAPLIGHHTSEILEEIEDIHSSSSSNNSTNLPKLPFEGLRAIDMTQVWAGPYGGRFLADMGADVIKVEGPSFPDPIRTMVGTTTSPEIDLSTYFNEYNRGKRSLIIDIKQSEGMKALKKLIKTADIFIENWSSGVADKNGLGYEDLKHLNPNIIYVSMPGFGHRGSDAERVGFGPTIEQMGGLVALQGYEGGPPHKSGISYGDPIAGATCGAAVAMALVNRTTTGKGSYCLIPQRDGITGLIGEFIVAEQLGSPLPVRSGAQHSIFAPHGIFECRPSKDMRPVLGPNREPAGYVNDMWLALSCRTDQEWQAFVKATKIDGLENSDYTGQVDRKIHEDTINQIISNWAKTQDVTSTALILQNVGVDASPVLTPLQISKDPHLLSRDMFISVNHDIAGNHLTTRPSWRFKRRSQVPTRSGPVFGGDSDAILSELGYTVDDITSLRKNLVSTNSIISDG